MKARSRPAVPLRYVAALLSTAAAFAATLLLEPFLEGALFTLFFAGVAISAWYGGYGAGVLASVLSVAIMQVFLDPEGSFTSPDVTGLTRITVVLFVAVLISGLSETLRQSRAEAERVAEQSARLQETTAALYREARLAVAARDEVLAFVSHDLRNSLAVVTYTVRLLLQDEIAERRRESLQRIVAAVEEMDRLTADLLAVSRAEAGHLELELEDVDVPPLLGEVCARMTELAASRGIDLECAMGSELPPVRADRRRLVHVLDNLLSNALKFTGAGGRVTARTTGAGDSLRFEVSDTGEGIAPDELPHVFDRFWHSRRSERAGTGLGLAICKAIVEAHGGRIWAESVPGRGSTFFFTLPAGALEADRPEGGHDLQTTDR